MKEFELLEHVYRANATLPPEVLIPPGDDMGMMRVGAVRLLVGVDQVVDGRHVDLKRVPVELAGRKAIARSLSDVAAMAAEPVGCLVAVTLPVEFGEKKARQLFTAMRETAEAFRCPLIGGDIAVHRGVVGPLTCSVTVFAVPAADGAIEPVTRGGARAGDEVYVTGELGGTLDEDGMGTHLTFVPRIDEAITLAKVLGNRLHSMIDISDGLGRDATHIAVSSGVHIEIDATSVPRRSGVNWRDAVSGGEDYELLFTASGDVPESIGSTRVTRVGRVSRSDLPGAAFVVDSAVIPAEEFGWEHTSMEPRR